LTADSYQLENTRRGTGPFDRLRAGFPDGRFFGSGGAGSICGLSHHKTKLNCTELRCIVNSPYKLNRGMEMLKLCIAAIGFSGILFLVAAAQETGSRSELPITASVNASEHLRLVPGNTHIFVLTLGWSPHVYESTGKIHYTFENQDTHDSKTKFDRIKVSGTTDVLDGQMNCDLSLHVTYEMLPGTWKLTEVTIGGRNKQIPVTIRNHVTFEILRVPPVLVHFQSPGT